MCTALSAFTMVRIPAKFLLRSYINTNSNIAYNECLKIKASASQFQLSESCEQAKQLTRTDLWPQGTKTTPKPFSGFKPARQTPYWTEHILLLQKNINSALWPVLTCTLTWVLLTIDLTTTDRYTEDREHITLQSVCVCVWWLRQKSTKRKWDLTRKKQISSAVRFTNYSTATLETTWLQSQFSVRERKSERNR